MGDPVAEFRRRGPAGIPPNPKADGAPSADMPPGSGDERLPTWTKWIVACNLVMVHLVIMLVGFEWVPFTLSDAALTAYVVTGLGIPVGLASRAVRGALASLFGINRREVKRTCLGRRLISKSI